MFYVIGLNINSSIFKSYYMRKAFSSRSSSRVTCD